MLCSKLGPDVDDEEQYNADQMMFMDQTRKSISIALQRGNAQAIIYRAKRDGLASGRFVPPIGSMHDWGIGRWVLLPVLQSRPLELSSNNVELLGLGKLE